MGEQGSLRPGLENYPPPAVVPNQGAQQSVAETARKSGGSIACSISHDVIQVRSNDEMGGFYFCSSCFVHLFHKLLQRLGGETGDTEQWRERRRARVETSSWCKTADRSFGSACKLA